MVAGSASRSEGFKVEAAMSERVQRGSPGDDGQRQRAVGVGYEVNNAGVCDGRPLRHGITAPE